MKKIISSILSFTLVFSMCMTVSVSAAQSSRTKTSDVAENARDYIEEGLEYLMECDTLDDALECFVKADELGDTDGAFLAGYTLSRIASVEGGNYDEEAMEYFEKSADANMFSDVCAALIYSNNSSPIYDMELANEYNVVAATMLQDVDDAPEGLEFVVYYLMGLWMVNEALEMDNYELAMEAFEYSAEYDYAPALVSLGCMYLYGYGVDEDPDTAMEYFEQASDLEYPVGMYYIGTMYDEGNGVEQDFEEAMKWYEMAAELGYPDAFENIGNLYDFGCGVDEDPETAMEYYEVAAEAGSAYAMNCIAYNYLSGTAVDEDYEEAFNWYMRAAETGDADGMNYVGQMYYEGYGVDQDYEEAINWYYKAAIRGNDVSMYHIGWMFTEGVGVDQDYEEAYGWYIQAADCENPVAMNNLGWFYLNGYGVDEDYDEAMKWFKLAAKYGNDKAMRNIGYIYEEGLGVDADQDIADEWYEKADKAEQGIFDEEEEPEEEPEDWFDEEDEEFDLTEDVKEDLGLDADSNKKGVIIKADSSEYEFLSGGWAGLVPYGYDYETEDEADSVDLIYGYVENYDSDEEPDEYEFIFDADSFKKIQDGYYILVLCNDDGGDAELLRCVTVEKVGKNLILDADPGMDEEDDSFGITLEYDIDEGYIINVASSYKLKDGAWIGVEPGGKAYKSESDADEVDITYSYAKNYKDKKASEDYRFVFPFYSIADLDNGEYAMVLCSDDTSSAKLLRQFAMYKYGSRVTIYFN